jgi:large subunit ribosomal protein L4
LYVVDDFSDLTVPKTKTIQALISSLGLTGKKVVFFAENLKTDNVNLALSARNIPKVTVALPANISVKSVVEADAVIMTKAALQEIEGRLAA